MMMPNKKRKRLIRGSIAVLMLVLIVFAINRIAASYLEDLINKEFILLNQSENYVVLVDDVDVRVQKGAILFRNLSISPSSSYRNRFSNGETGQEVMNKLTVDLASMEGLSIFKLLITKRLDIDRILVQNLDFTLTRPRNFKGSKSLDPKKKATFSIDSIQIPWLKSAALDKLQIENYGLHTLEGMDSDTISSFTGNQFLVSGFDILESETKGFFQFDNSAIEIQMEQQRFNLKGGLYYLAFDRFRYKLSEDLVLVHGFEYAPVDSQQAVADTQTYTTDVMDAYVKQLSIHGFKFRSAVVSGAIDVDLVDVDSLNINLFKDKRKPWNKDKRPKLPHESLRQLKQPLHVDSVRLRNTQFVYTERLPDTDTPVRVTIDNIDAKLEYITSIKDSLKADKPLLLNLKADLLNAMPLEANLSMPYNKSQFRFWGTTSGATTFTRINPVVFPAIGIKFQSGTLDGISFDAWATNSHMDGNFILRYTDLEVEFYNKDDSKESKTVSWLANSVAKRSNPSKRGKLSVAKINQDRFMYKGIGNFLWKGIQSGVVNSVAPFGNRRSSKRKL